VQDSYLLVFTADPALARWVKDHLKPKAMHITE
jgi:hypothetical protein